MRIREDDAAEDMVLNLTPMFDVVFLLLIFFMVATTFLDPEREIDIELPQAESGNPLEEEPDEVLIHVFRDGRVELDGREYDDGALLETLRLRAQRNPRTSVTIRGDRLAHHERIVAVMDACGLAGLGNLAIGTTDGS